MATPTFCCGFEEGIFATIETVDHHHWTMFDATPTYYSADKRTGTYSMRFNPSASVQSIDRFLAAGSRNQNSSFYIKFNTLPNVDSIIASFYQGGDKYGIKFINSDDTLRCGSETGSHAASGVVVTTGTWYRVDYRVNSSANPLLVDGYVNGTALTQYSEATAAADLTSQNFGTSDSVTSEFFIDDVVASATSADFPLSGGADYAVNGLYPNADGTHVTGAAGTFERTATGTDITDATTTAWQLIEEVPLGGGADDIRMMLNGTTNYVETAFANLPAGRTPKAVEALVALHQTATGAGTSTSKLNDGGTEADIIARTGAGVVAVHYRRKLFEVRPNGGSAWDATSVNALLHRFGYSSDANPDQGFDGVLLEVWTIASALNVNLAGAQPASTGILTALRLKSLSGSQPADAGTLGSLQTLLKTLAGAQPTPSGTLVSLQFKALAGSQPSATGSIASIRLLFRSLAGSQPAPTGTIAAQLLQAIELAGSQPAATGTLSARQTLLKSLAGAQPASTGTLASKQTLLRTLAGAQPTATGTIGAQAITSANVAGSQPSATGALTKKYLITVRGNQPSATGSLRLVISTRLQGSQPSATGALTARKTIFKALAGSQPSATGSIAAQSVVGVSLSGSQPAASGVAAANFLFYHIALAGSQPAPSGSLRLVAAIAIAGIQPSASGALTVFQLGVTLGKLLLLFAEEVSTVYVNGGEVATSFVTGDEVATSYLQAGDGTVVLLEARE